MANDNRTVNPHHRMCRIWGHAWDYTTVKQQGREYLQGLACIRCGTERYVTINTRTGEAKSARYRYADGYLFTAGGSLTPNERAELRLAEIQGRMSRKSKGKP